MSSEISDFERGTPLPPADDLRHAFTALAEDSRPSDDCPPPKRLWQAVSGRLASAETAALVDHVAACPSCALAWRLAREVTPAEPSAEVLPYERRRDAPRPSAGWRRWAALAAVLALTAIGLAVWQRGEAPREAFRSSGAEGAPSVRSLIPAERPLSRGAAVLAWTPVAGARYDVYVSTPDLRPVYQLRDLEEARIVLPASALADLAPGSELVWRVEAHLPDGTGIRSPTFRQRLE